MKKPERDHLLTMATRMRRVVVDDARANARPKGDQIRQDGAVEPVDLVALDDALHALAQVDERTSKVVELRFFGGLTVEKTAEVLEVSVAVARREWISARTWLRRKMRDIPQK